MKTSRKITTFSLCFSLPFLTAAASTTVKLPRISSADDKPTEQPPNPLPSDQRVGFAVVGLGHLALGEIIPAMAECKYAKLTALVSGHPETMTVIGKQYGITPAHQYTYQTYEKLKDDPDVQVVYIVLPNSLHKEYTLRGAAIGKHILCEKPMATTVADAEKMVQACKKAGVKLMIAYRMQYEPYNRAMIQLTRDKTLGDLKTITAENNQNVGDPAQWRLNGELSGGGPLPDVGIYCLNAARYITGKEPTEVYATLTKNLQDSRFKEVEEQLNWVMKFPDGVTMNGFAGYSAYTVRRYRLFFTKGWAELDPAFAYEGLRMRVAHLSPDGKHDIIEERPLPYKNQFALEMDHMAKCVLENKIPHTPGEEGLQDMKIIEALYHSAKIHRPVELPGSSKTDAFRGSDVKSDD